MKNNSQIENSKMDIYFLSFFKKPKLNFKKIFKNHFRAYWSYLKINIKKSVMIKFLIKMWLILSSLLKC